MVVTSFNIVLTFLVGFLLYLIPSYAYIFALICFHYCVLSSNFSELNMIQFSVFKSNGHLLQHCHRPHIPCWVPPLPRQTPLCDQNPGGENSSQCLQPQPCALPFCLRWGEKYFRISDFYGKFDISGVGTMICLPASIWLLNEERNYEETTFQIRPMHIFELGPFST